MMLQKWFVLEETFADENGESCFRVRLMIDEELFDDELD